jgi:hypothetical protein
MRRALFFTLLLTTALVLAPAAEAGPFYLLAKLGSTDVAVDVAGGFDNVLDGDDNSSSFGLGMKFGKHMAFQAEYHDLGSVAGFASPCTEKVPACLALALPVEADSSAISVTFLPHLLLTERLQIYAKVGFISWDTDISAVGSQGRDFLDSFDDEELVYGAGLRLEMRRRSASGG